MRINTKLAIIILSIVVPSMVVVFFLSNTVFNDVSRQRERHDYIQSEDLLKNIIELHNDKLSLVLQSVKNDDAFLHSTLLANELEYTSRPESILKEYLDANNLSFFIFINNDGMRISNVSTELRSEQIDQLCSSQDMMFADLPMGMVSKCDKLRYYGQDIGLVIIGYYLSDYINLLSVSLSKKVDVVFPDEAFKLNKYNLSALNGRVENISIRNIDDNNYYVYNLDDFFAFANGYLLIDNGPRISVFSRYTSFGKMLVHYLVLFIVIILSLYFIFWLLISKRLNKIHEFISNQLLKRDISLKQTRSASDEIDEIDVTISDLFDKLSEYQREKEEAAHLAAIGQSTAMVAHDVRKPFSQIKGVLDSFEEFQKEPGALEIAKKNINKSIKHVETMLSDIMDFSRSVKLEVKPESIVNVLDFSIRETTRGYADKNISFQYKITNTHKPMIDEERLSRAFANIIGNGIEAITQIGKKNKGIIWIESHNKMSRDSSSMTQNDKITLIIGNDGPPINGDDLPNLFESFFTKGKKKGTGLGLASTHKIVTLHGGSIVVRNRPDNTGVEFEIELPASDEKEDGDLSRLPLNISETQFVEVKKCEEELREIVDQIAKKKSNYKVVLLEDEALYRASVRNTIKKDEKLHNILTLYEAVNVNDAIKLIEKEDITHAIVDIDLSEEKDGFDFLENVREKYPSLKCMVHSNRCIEEDRDRSFGLGALAFVPKPLNLEHLVMFLADKSLEISCNKTSSIKDKTLSEINITY